MLWLVMSEGALVEREKGVQLRVFVWVLNENECGKIDIVALASVRKVYIARYC